MSIVDKIKAELKKTLGMVEETFKDEPMPTDELKISDLVLGGKVEVVNDDQTLSPAQNGKYTVGEDVIKVEDGLIVEINGEGAKAEESVEANEEVKAEEAPIVPDVQLQIEELKANVSALSTGFQDLQVVIEEMKQNFTKEAEATEKFSTQLQELNDTIKALAVTPAEFSKTNNSNKVKDSKEQKMTDLFRAFALIK